MRHVAKEKDTRGIVKKPGYGIKPKFIDVIVGREAKRDIKGDEWICWKMICIAILRSI